MGHRILGRLAGRWRRGLATAGCAAGVVGAFCWVRAALLPRAEAEPPAVVAPAATQPAAAPDLVPVPGSDYARRVVAYLHDNQPVTREELGEYLIARHGDDRLDLLINRRIIDKACREHSIAVTEGEIEASLLDDLKGLSIDRRTFIQTVLGRYGKTLYEWKEDVIRPKLLLSKLCRDRVHVTFAEVENAFQAAYGEKMECRIVLYPATPEGRKQAVAEYPALRDSPEAFEEAAKKQFTPGLASCGGKLKPFGRFTMTDQKLESEAFKLQPGKVSEVLETPQGFVVIRCERRISPDTSVNRDAVRPRLEKEVLEKKVMVEMAQLFKDLRTKADPKRMLSRDREGRTVDAEGAVAAGVSRAGEVVATIHGNDPITREDLGEFLIARYGPQNLELLVNRRIIDRACKEHNVTVGDAEVQASLADDLKKLNVDEEHFVKDVLKGYHKTLFEYKEDVVRPRLLMTKLCRDRVKPSDNEVKQAFEAHYGEKVECKVILWPTDQVKFALQEYSKIRDSEEEFDRAARRQASPTLAARGGLVPPFGRHTTGDESMEREAFRLKPGEVSSLIGTPQGHVVLRCVRRIPADESHKLTAERERLTREVVEKKVQIEMQTAFKELRDAANPRLILKDPNKPIDIAAETKQVLDETAPLAGDNGPKIPTRAMQAPPELAK